VRLTIFTKAGEEGISNNGIGENKSRGSVAAFFKAKTKTGPDPATERRGEKGLDLRGT
jgi:hypothetical protein